MTNQKQKKQEKVTDGINPVAAVVTGAVVGVGVAVAGAIALNDEKNRQKVKEVLANAKDRAIDYVETLKTEPKIDQVTQKIEQIATDTKEVLEKSI